MPAPVLLRRTVLAAAVATAALAGCANLGGTWVEVSTFGDWPAGRAPGSYAFDHLPSQAQAAQAERLKGLEEAAAAALAGAGFKPVAAGAEPELLVQVGVRVSRTDQSPWDDPFWWRGGFGRWRHGPWVGPFWGVSVRTDPPRYEREVALLIRDRSSGKPLFEAHASTEGFQKLSSTTLAPLFTAALTGFPALGENPRQVLVPAAP
jgi:hypothetical protein